jgi:hypothetical protein
LYRTGQDQSAFPKKEIHDPTPSSVDLVIDTMVKNDAIWTARSLEGRREGRKVCEIAGSVEGISKPNHEPAVPLEPHRVKDVFRGVEMRRVVIGVAGNVSK